MTKRIFISLCLGWSLVTAAAAAPKTGRGKTSVTKEGPAQRIVSSRRTNDTPVASADIQLEAKVVPYGKKDIVRLRTRLRYTTLIVLPDAEQIVEVTCGDRDMWVVNAARNLAYVKPAKTGARSNLNLVTAPGRVYSFVLEEVSEHPALPADLKVFVEPKEDSMITSAGAPVVPASQIDEYKRQVEAAKAEAKAAKQAAVNAADNVDRFRWEYPGKLTFDYRFQAHKRPFCVTSMFHDDKFTYIQATPQEIPTLYELKDGKPNLINFEYRNRAFVAPKILDSGYLMIGNHKLGFARRKQP